MAKTMELDEGGFRRWLEQRPSVIREMVASHPPDRLYRMKSSGHRATIAAYSENRTVRVAVTGRYNVVAFDRDVFDVPIDDLEECDLPPENELCMTILSPEEVDQALAAAGGTEDERLQAITNAAAAKLRRS